MPERGRGVGTRTVVGGYQGRQLAPPEPVANGQTTPGVAAAPTSPGRPDDMPGLFFRTSAARTRKRRTTAYSPRTMQQLWWRSRRRRMFTAMPCMPCTGGVFRVFPPCRSRKPSQEKRQMGVHRREAGPPPAGGVACESFRPGEPVS